MSDAIDVAEFKQTGTSTAVALHDDAPLTYFTAVRPAQRLAFATEVADSLKPVLTQKKLTHNLNKKRPDDEYVEPEAAADVPRCGMAKIEDGTAARWRRP